MAGRISKSCGWEETMSWWLCIKVQGVYDRISRSGAWQNNLSFLVWNYVPYQVWSFTKRWTTSTWLRTSQTFQPSGINLLTQESIPLRVENFIYDHTPSRNQTQSNGNCRRDRNLLPHLPSNRSSLLWQLLVSPYDSLEKTYQLQRPVRTPPGIANIYEIHIPNKIMRNSHHINLPSFQRDYFSLQEETYCQSQEAVL